MLKSLVAIALLLICFCPPLMGLFWMVLRMSSRSSDDDLTRLIAPCVRLYAPDADMAQIEQDKLVRIDNLSFPPDRIADHPEFRDAIQIGCRIAVYESPRLGITGFVTYFVAHRMRLEIVRFAVLPTQRRLGIGSALLHWCLEEAVKWEVDDITCDIFEDAVEAQLLLKSLGFRYVCKINDDYPLVENVDIYRFLLSTDMLCEKETAISRSKSSQ